MDISNRLDMRNTSLLGRNSSNCGLRIGQEIVRRACWDGPSRDVLTARVETLKTEYKYNNNDAKDAFKIGDRHKEDLQVLHRSNFEAPLKLP